MDVENLNFNVIVNDKEFDENVTKIETRAQKFNTTVSKSLELELKINTSGLLSDMSKVKTEAAKYAKDIEKAFKVNLSTKQIISSKGVQNAQAMLPLLRQISNEIANMPKPPVIFDPAKLDDLISKLDRYIGGTTAGNEKLNASFGRSRGLLGELAGLASQYFSARGIANFVSSMVKITGELEMQRVALKNILQDADAADKVFGQLKELAVQSPYTLQELTQYTKQLSAFSFPKEELFETNKMLADVAAGLGVSMDRIILAYGQVRAASFLRGQEVRQFTESGIPILEMLAKQFSEVEGRMISAAEVFTKISARQVPFEMVARAFKDMTSEGGKFYQMQEVLAQTLQGRIMKLKDNWQIALSDMGNSSSTFLKGAVDFAITLTKNLDTVLRLLVPIIAAFGANGLVKDAEKLYGVVKAMTQDIKKAGSLFASWSGWGIILAAVAAITAVIWQGVAAANKFRKEIEAIENEKLSNMEKNLDILDNIKARLNDTTEGTQHYRDAVHDLNSKLGEFLPNLVAEADGLNAVKDAAWGAEAAIRAKALASAEDAIRQKLNDKYRKQMENSTQAVENMLANAFPVLTDKDIAIVLENFKNALRLDNVSTGGTILSNVLSKYLGKDIKINESNWVQPGMFAATFRKYEKELDKLLTGLGDKFATPYDTKAIADGMAKIEEEYTAASREALKLKGDQEAYNEAIKKADIAKLQKIIKLYKEAGDESSAKPYESRLAKLTAVPTGWQKLADDALAKLGAKGRGKGDSGLWAEATDNYWDYIDALQKGYKEVSEKKLNLGKQEKTELGKQVADEIKARKAVAEALGVSLIAKKAPGAGTMSPEEKKIRTDIDAIKELQRAYNELIKDGFTEREANELIDIYFSWMNKSVRDRRDFWVELGEEADALQKYDKDAAERLRADIGRGQAQESGAARKAEIKQAEKDLKKYLEVLEKWTNATKELSGTGAAFGISSAIANYNKSEKQNESTFWENLVLGTKAYKNDPAKQVEQYFKLLELKTQNHISNLAKLKNDVSKYADDIVKEGLSGFDLTNWDKKTVSQINEIRDALGKIDIPDEIKKDLEKYQEILPFLQGKLEEIKNKYLDNTINPELSKKWAKDIKSACSYLSKGAAAMQKLAEASHDANLENLAETISNFSGTLEAMAAGFASGGPVGMAIAGLGTFINVVISGIAKIETELYAFKQALNEARVDIESSKFRSALEEGVSSVFGDNFIKQLQNAKEQLDGLETRMESIREDFKEWKHDWMASNVGIPGLPQPIEMQKNINAWDERLQDLKDIVVKWGDSYRSIEEIAQELDMDLYDKNDNISASLLEKIIGISGGDGENSILNRLLKYAQDYAEALKSIEAVMGEIFSDIASSAADKIVDSWIEAGSAALDYADILDDVAKSYAKMLIQSAILGKVLTEEHANEIADKIISGDVDGAMQSIANDMEQIAGMEPVFDSILSMFDPYFNTSSGSNSTGAGIKSITEDTANLLASYINAMRADLSYMRGLQEKGWSVVDAIGVAVPKLNDYLAQIAASTANAAEDTNNILSELRNVIGSPDSSGMIVRVQMA